MKNIEKWKENGKKLSYLCKRNNFEKIKKITNNEKWKEIEFLLHIKQFQQNKKITNNEKWKILENVGEMQENPKKN